MQSRLFVWTRVLAWITVFPLAVVLCLPGAAVVVDVLQRGYSLGLPLPIEFGLVGLVGLTLAVLLFSEWLLTRGLSWAVVFLGLAALANALSPGRDADSQFTWLVVGAVLGALAGLLIVPRTNRRTAEAPATQAATASPPQTIPADAAPVRLGRRALVVGVLAVCVVAAVCLRYGIRVGIQARVSQAVARAEGTTTYDHASTPPLLFKWLDALPRSDEHHCLTGVTLGPGAGDEQLAELAEIGLGNLPHLRDLRLRHSRVTDSGLVIVAPLGHLERLSLSHATTDAGLASVQNLLSLQHLDLSETRITGQGLRYATHLPELLYLSLRHTRIGDDDLPQLRAFTQLVCLDLSGTAITDAGLAHLKELPSLSSLVVMRTHVTDKGLQHIADYPQLRWLFIGDTQVTATGARELRRKRPGMFVE